MAGKVNPIPNRREALGIKAVSWFHRIAYSLPGGRLLGVVAGAPVLLLTTTGDSHPRSAFLSTPG